jgi:hypothetical protein
METYTSSSPPIAIGGVGGSGTRAVAAVLQAADFYLGPDLNEALDCQIFSLFFKRQEIWPPENHIQEIDTALRAFLNGIVGRRPWTAEEEAYIRSLALSPRPNLPRDWLEWRVKVLLDQQPMLPPARWGWKEPNTHIVLPRLLQKMPQLRYIHVMRHGLDMAFSENQEQVLYWGAQMLEEPVIEITPARSFAYWCEAHRRLLHLSREYPGRILLLPLEQLCGDTGPQMERISRFCNLDPEGATLSAMASQIGAPETINRHLQHDTSWVTDEQVAVLSNLGYAAT